MREQPAYNQTVHMLLPWLFNTIFLLVKRAKVLYVVPKKPSIKVLQPWTSGDLPSWNKSIAMPTHYQDSVQTANKE